MCWNCCYFEIIYLRKLDRFGFGSTSHSGELLVHAKVILERDRGERLRLPFDLDAFLRLDRLVEPIRPAASCHDASSELVNDHDLAIAHNVLLVAMIERMSNQRLIEAMQDLHVRRIVEIAITEYLLSLLDAWLGQRG